jgi:hypothetical protein
VTDYSTCVPNLSCACKTYYVFFLSIIYFYDKDLKFFLKKFFVSTYIVLICHQRYTAFVFITLVLLMPFQSIALWACNVVYSMSRLSIVDPLMFAVGLQFNVSKAILQLPRHIVTLSQGNVYNMCYRDYISSVIDS